MTNNNTYLADRQELDSVNQLKDSWGTHHSGIAQDYGVSESIFVTYIWKWIKHNLKANTNIKDKKAWTYGSLEYLCKNLPQWTEDQVRHVIKKCVQKGLIIVGQFHDNKYNKTNWYTLTDHALTQCQVADRNPLILNFSEQLDLASENEILRKKISELESKNDAKLPHGKSPTWENQGTPEDFELNYPDLNSYPSFSKKYITNIGVVSEKSCGTFPTSLHRYKYQDRNPRKEDYLKNSYYPFGEIPSRELPSGKQTFFKDINDLEDSHPQIEPINTFEVESDTSVVSITCDITEYCLTNPYGCSAQKIKDYLEMRRNCKAAVTHSTWSSAVKFCLEIVREKTKLTPDEAMDILIARKDSNTKFLEVFAFALGDVAVEKFEKEALSYSVARGQAEESVRVEFERIAIKHKISSDYDFDNLLTRFYNKPSETKDIEDEYADTFLESMTKQTAKPIIYHSEEPEYRRQFQAEAQAKANPDLGPITFTESLKSVGALKAHQGHAGTVLTKGENSVGDCTSNHLSTPKNGPELTVDAFLAGILNKIAGQRKSDGRPGNH